MTEFVCIDGEGVDTERANRVHTVRGSDRTYTSKEHIYTLLCSSSMHHIENWENGLSTTDCLEFILKEHKPGTTVVGFSLGYDDNMMFRNIHPDVLSHLWNDGYCMHIDEEKKAIYHLKYVPGKWLDIKKMWHEEYKQKEKTAKLWDVFGFFQHSFIKSIDEWLTNRIDVKEILDVITHMKERRGSFQEEKQEDIIYYCKQECILLKTLMIQLDEALQGMGVHLKSWHGAAAICKNLFRENEIANHVRWNSIPEQAQEAALWSYFGGNVQLFQQGLIDGPIYDYDRVSSYPSSIVNLPSLQGAEWYQCDGGEIHVKNENCMYAMWRVSWDTSEHRLSWLAPFPQRGKDGLIYWSSRGQGWYHACEVLAALRIFGSCIHVDAGVYLRPYTDVKPFSFMRDLIEQRVRWKLADDPRHIPAKLGFNAGYGVLAQGVSRDGHVPSYQNYFLAGRITAETRAEMLLAASLLDHEKVVCIATDGIFTRAELPDFECTNQIGGWERGKTINTPSFWAQAGVFFTPEGTIKRTRGFHSTSIEYPMCVQEWERTGGDWLDFHIPYIERRFTGLGYCASTGRWEEYRRWIDRERELTLVTLPRKMQTRRVDGGPYVLMPQDMQVERRPYQAKLPNAEQMKLFGPELQSFWEALDQEEYGD